MLINFTFIQGYDRIPYVEELEKHIEASATEINARGVVHEQLKNIALLCQRYLDTIGFRNSSSKRFPTFGLDIPNHTLYSEESLTTTFNSQNEIMPHKNPRIVLSIYFQTHELMYWREGIYSRAQAALENLKKAYQLGGSLAMQQDYLHEIRRKIFCTDEDSDMEIFILKSIESKSYPILNKFSKYPYQD